MKLNQWAAAAAATMFACAAHAQSNVTIYGLFDVGVQLDDASNGKTAKVVSGGNYGSRLGFRGAEDLGGGLSAIFTAEHGINVDTGGLAQGGRFFGRQVFAGFKGTWGTLVAVWRLSAQAPAASTCSVRWTRCPRLWALRASARRCPVPPR
jgi:predicted porin